MNIIGKVFVVLIFLMSVVFLSLTVVLYASHNNWKDRAADIEGKIKPAEQEKDRLADEKNALIEQINDEKIAYQKTVAALKTKSVELTADNTRLAKKNDELDAHLDKRTEVITDNNITIKAMQTNIDQLSQGVAAAQQSRSEYLADLATTVNQLHEQAVTIGDLEKRNKELLEDFEKAKAVLDMNDLTATPELYDRVPATNISAKVVAIKDGKFKLVMIDAGADDGLKSKHTLEVHRGSSYLGRVEVVTTQPHQAVCRIMPQYQKGEIMEGDSVKAKFE